MGMPLGLRNSVYFQNVFIFFLQHDKDNKSPIPFQITQSQVKSSTCILLIWRYSVHNVQNSLLFL